MFSLSIASGWCGGGVECMAGCGCSEGSIIGSSMCACAHYALTSVQMLILPPAVFGDGESRVEEFGGIRVTAW